MNQTNRLPLKRTFARFYLRLPPSPSSLSGGDFGSRFQLFPIYTEIPFCRTTLCQLRSATGRVIFRPIILRMCISKAHKCPVKHSSGTLRAVYFRDYGSLRWKAQAFELGLGRHCYSRYTPLCRYSSLYYRLFKRY